MREIWSEFWRGYIQVKIIKNIHKIPETAKYKYTDEKEHLDIYAEMNNMQITYYGLMI